MSHEPMPLHQALELADHASPTPEDACRALRTLRASIEQQQKDAARWRALREMDGGAIHLLLGDYDGMRPELADRALDLYLEARDDFRRALSGGAGMECPAITP